MYLQSKLSFSCGLGIPAAADFRLFRTRSGERSTLPQTSCLGGEPPATHQLIPSWAGLGVTARFHHASQPRFGHYGQRAHHDAWLSLAGCCSSALLRAAASPAQHPASRDGTQPVAPQTRPGPRTCPVGSRHPRKGFQPGRSPGGTLLPRSRPLPLAPAPHAEPAATLPGCGEHTRAVTLAPPDTAAPQYTIFIA